MNPLYINQKVKINVNFRKYINEEYRGILIPPKMEEFYLLNKDKELTVRRCDNWFDDKGIQTFSVILNEDFDAFSWPIDFIIPVENKEICVIRLKNGTALGFNKEELKDVLTLPGFNYLDDDLKRILRFF
jgi:hypothetical protein